MDTIQKLTELFKQFPGIGPRQAKRFVYYILSQPGGYGGDLSRLVSELKNDIVACDMCQRFFPKNAAQNNGGEPLCSICRDEKRDKTVLMIVSRDADLENIEKTKSFKGFYFVLGGSVPILDGNPEERIRQKELAAILPKRLSAGLKEVILALDYNPEGENTREYIEGLLGPLSIRHGFKISHLGRGLSSGSELEYTDPDTLKNALQNRR